MNMEKDTLEILNEIEQKCQQNAEENEDIFDKEDNNQDIERSVVEEEVSLCTDEHKQRENENKSDDLVKIGDCLDSEETQSVKSIENDQEIENTDMNEDTKDAQSNDAVEAVTGMTATEESDSNSDIVSIDVNKSHEFNDENSKDTANEFNDDNSIGTANEFSNVNSKDTTNESNDKNNKDTANEFRNDNTQDTANDSNEDNSKDKAGIDQDKATVSADDNTEMQIQNFSIQGESEQINESSDQLNDSNNTGISNDDSYEDVAKMGGFSSVLSTRGRKRRKRWGKDWSNTSPYKKKKMTFTRTIDLVSTEKGTCADLDSTAEAMNDSCTTPGDEVKSEIKAKLEGSAKGRKRKSLLFDLGQIAYPGDKPPLPPEVFEMYSEPFKHGWRRELVMRGIVGENYSPAKKLPPSDVYYFPPYGAKVRSMVQIQEWLIANGSALTADNFTFMRRPIGVEEGEVVRQAQASRGRAAALKLEKSELVTPETRRKKVKPLKLLRSQIGDELNNSKYAKPMVVIERDSDEFLNPLLRAVELGIPEGDLPPVRFDTTASCPIKRGRPKKPVKEEYPVKQEKVEMMHPSNETVIVTPPKHRIKPTARKSTTQKVVKQQLPYIGTENLCTMKCPGLEGMAPMLMCRKCMCLFHHECVNYYDDDDDFSCLRCQTSQSQSTETQKPPLIMKVKLPEKFSQVDKNNIKVTSVHSVLSNTLFPELQNSVSQPIGNAKQPSEFLVFPPSSLQGSVTLPLMPGIKSLSKYPEIKPLLKVKEEPNDSSYDSAKNACHQASSEALGSLKSILNARNSLSSPTLNTDQYLNQPVDLNRPYTGSPRISTPTTLSKAARSNMSLIGNRISPVLNPNPLSLLNNRPLQLTQNSNFRLVPIGPPVSLPNIPLQPVRLPGMNVQGLMPVGTLPQSIQGLSSPSIQKTALAANSQSTSQSLNCLTNMVSMVESKSKHDTPLKDDNSSKKGSNKAARLVIDGTTIGAPESGQLLTLPGAISKKLTLSKPLVLKIKNRQISVPPSGFFHASDGLKIFLPPNTFPTAEEEAENSASPEKDSKQNTEKTKHANVENGTEDANDAALKQKTVHENVTKQNSETENKTSTNTEESESTVNNVSQVKTVRDICKSRQYRKCCLIQKLYGGYDCMYHIFCFLGIKELNTVSQVCRTWRMISLHPSLWNDATFKGVRVSSWSLAMQFLKQRGVSSISLVGMRPYNDLEQTWKDFITSVEKVPSIEKITFGLVPPLLLDAVCLKLTNLKSVCAQCVSNEEDETMWTTPTRLDIGKFGSLSALQELRLKGVYGLTLPTFSLCGGLNNLSAMQHLETLSLTSLKNVEASKFEFLLEMKYLKELALGECKNWTVETYKIISQLSSLRKLRLEHGGEIPDSGLGEAVGKLPDLHTLELYTWTIADTFKEHLQQLPMLKTLVIWPDNSSQQAEINSNAFAAIRNLQSLHRLKWVIMNGSSGGIILDDNENTEAVSKEQEWIPFVLERGENIDSTPENRVLEYVGVRQLTENLSKLLPDTRINVYCLKPEQEKQDRH